MPSKIEKLATEARNSLSKYCYSECKAYCCRKGYLPMTEKEALIVSGNKKIELIRNMALSPVKNNEYILDLAANKNGCPQLSDFKCKIHNHVDMPKTCSDFPIFLWKGKKIRVSDRCSAVKAGILYPYIAQFKQMGYKFIEE
jgi:hypothetical protein